MVKFLIIYPGALGDILLTRPALFCIKQKFKDCLIDYAGNPDYLQLLHDEINVIFDFHSSKLLSLFSEKLELELTCKIWLESYDTIIFWSTLKDELVQTKLTSLKNTKSIYQSIKPPWYYKKHQTVFCLKSLESLGIFSNENIQKEIPYITASKTIKKENLICIHPGSGSKTKNLPLKIYKQMIKKIQEKTNFKTIFILGPAEDAYLNQLKNGEFEIVSPNNVIHLKEILSKSKYFIGNDSGVTHLAAQLGISTLAIFISTNPIVYAPIGPNVFIIHNQNSVKNQFHISAKITSQNLVKFFLEQIFTG